MAARLGNNGWLRVWVWSLPSVRGVVPARKDGPNNVLIPISSPFPRDMSRREKKEYERAQSEAANSKNAEA